MEIRRPTLSRPLLDCDDLGTFGALTTGPHSSVLLVCTPHSLWRCRDLGFFWLKIRALGVCELPTGGTELVLR